MWLTILHVVVVAVLGSLLVPTTLIIGTYIHDSLGSKSVTIRDNRAIDPIGPLAHIKVIETGERR